MAPEQQWFRGNFCYLTLSSVLLSYGRQFVLDLSLPGLVNMFCASRADVVSRQFFFPKSVERFSLVWVLRLGVFEFGCVGCCLPVGTSAMSRKVLFVRWRQISPSLT